MEEAHAAAAGMMTLDSTILALLLMLQEALAGLVLAVGQEAGDALPGGRVLRLRQKALCAPGLVMRVGRSEPPALEERFNLASLLARDTLVVSALAATELLEERRMRGLVVRDAIHAVLVASLSLSKEAGRTRREPVNLDIGSPTALFELSIHAAHLSVVGRFGIRRVTH